jgi:hypothetical protein
MKEICKNMNYAIALYTFLNTVISVTITVENPVFIGSPHTLPTVCANFSKSG